MSSRLRSLDSKISFFAFADIITAVSGVLIFVALLLATDLGRPTDDRAAAAATAMEQRLEETLAQQAAADVENHRLETLLAAAAAAPEATQLRADIARLQTQLSQAQSQQKELARQMADRQAVIDARDRELGLTDLKATIQRTLQETEAIGRQAAVAQREMDQLDQAVAHRESQLLKLRQRAGQLWLIPDPSTTTKEPILVTVAGAGVTWDRFDHPNDRQSADKSGAETAFKSYLSHARALDQYVVFLVRPSGIGRFKDLIKTARDLGFEVGSDALEEDREIHFSSPPPLDEPTPPPGAPAAAATPAPATPHGPAAPAGKPAAGNAPAGNAGPAATAARATPPPATATPSPATPKNMKSWWQRLLEWLGFK